MQVLTAMATSWSSRTRVASCFTAASSAQRPSAVTPPDLGPDQEGGTRTRRTGIHRRQLVDHLNIPSLGSRLSGKLTQALGDTAVNRDPETQ